MSSPTALPERLRHYVSPPASLIESLVALVEPTRALRDCAFNHPRSSYLADLDSIFFEEKPDLDFLAIAAGLSTLPAVERDHRYFIYAAEGLDAAISVTLASLRIHSAGVSFHGTNGPHLDSGRQVNPILLERLHRWEAAMARLREGMRDLDRYHASTLPALAGFLTETPAPAAVEATPEASSPASAPPAPPAQPAPPGTVAAAGPVAEPEVSAVLSRDQEFAVSWLTSFSRRRRTLLADSLPKAIVESWMVPLLIGPSQSGKGFVCREVARRLGKTSGFLRLDIASWIVVANDTRRSTYERAIKFATDHPDGVLYLSGADRLSTKAAGSPGDRSIGYTMAVLSELERLIDTLCSRDYAVEHQGSCPLVVVGGHFGALWGETVVGGDGGADAWRLADPDALTPNVLQDWMFKESGVPSSLLRRTTVSPLVVRRVGKAESVELAHRIVRLLPMLDGGLDPVELAEGLCGKIGWDAVRRAVETHLCGPPGGGFLPAEEREWLEDLDLEAAPVVESASPVEASSVSPAGWFDLESEIVQARARLRAQGPPGSEEPAAAVPPGASG